MNAQDLIKKLQDIMWTYGDNVILTITDGNSKYTIKDITGRLYAQGFHPSDNVSEAIVRICKEQ